MSKTTEIKVFDWKVLKIPGSVGQEHWITAEELGRHLGYENPRQSVNKIYNEHAETFIDKVDTTVTKTVTARESRKTGKTIEQKLDTRIFSESGALMICRYSDQTLANKVMRHVIDVFINIKNAKAKADVVAGDVLEYYLTHQPGQPPEGLLPNALYKAVGKMYQVDNCFPGKPCPAMGNFVNQYMYRCMPQNVFYELKNVLNPGTMWNRKYTHTQFLTEKAQQWLREHIAGTIAIIRACSHNRNAFHQAHRRAYPVERSIDELIENKIVVNQLHFEFYNQMVRL